MLDGESWSISWFWNSRLGFKPYAETEASKQKVKFPHMFKHRSSAAADKGDQPMDNGWTDKLGCKVAQHVTKKI